MKRPLHWFLGILAALALAAGAVGWDANRRAWRAFEEHERRVAAQIAGLRARHAAAPGHGAHPIATLFPIWNYDKQLLDAVAERRESGMYFPYEEGAKPEFWSARYISDWPDTPPLPAESFLAALGAAQDVIRGGGSDMAYVRLSEEHAALMGWRSKLEAHSLTVPRAREILKSLETLESSRPPISDAVLADFLMECRTIIKVLRDRADPLDYVQEDPGKNSFFSWKILLVQMLNERTDEFREIDSLRADTAFNRVMAIDRKSEEFHGRRRFMIPRWFQNWAGYIIQQDGFLRDRWLLARVATAVAGYQAQHGRSPASLHDLVPEWLPEFPRSPYSGSPFYWEEGCVVSPTHDLRADDTYWRVRRMTP